jgi:hypothetical protein
VDCKRDFDDLGRSGVSDVGRTDKTQSESNESAFARGNHMALRQLDV